jgi:beta-glucanase (GH16 family)
MKSITEDFADSGKLSAAQSPIWSEEFDSGTAPDSDIWSFDLGDGGWGNNELQAYTRDATNVRVEDGHLIITAVKQENHFTSGRIKTEEKFTFKYGTLEARIQVPDLGNGLWPALWALGHKFSSVGWPACSEIIVMEMGVEGAVDAGVVNRRITSAAHWEYNELHETDGLTLDHPSDLDGSFHIYRMEWTPTAITTYIDNIQIWTMNISGIPELHEPHFLLLNLAVGGIHTGICDSGGITAPFPAEFRVDYLRIFDNGFTSLGGSSVQSETSLE